MGSMPPSCKQESGHGKSGLRAMTSPQSLIVCGLARVVLCWSSSSLSQRKLQSRMEWCVLSPFCWSYPPSFYDSSWLLSQRSTRTEAEAVKSHPWCMWRGAPWLNPRTWGKPPSSLLIEIRFFIKFTSCETTDILLSLSFLIRFSSNKII